MECVKCGVSQPPQTTENKCLAEKKIYTVDTDIKTQSS